MTAPILLLTINPGLQILGTLKLGYVGGYYSVTLQAVGGLSPYVFAVTSSLPGTLTATDNGDGTLTIRGSVDTAYNGTVDVQVTDARNKRVRKVLSLVFIDAFRVTQDGTPRITQDGELRLLG